MAYCDRTLLLDGITRFGEVPSFVSIVINGNSYGTDTPFLISDTEALRSFINNLGFGIVTITGNDTAGYLLTFLCNNNGITKGNLQLADLSFVTSTTTTETNCQDTPCDTCGECYEITEQACQTSYTLNWNMTASTAFTIVFKDLHQHKYQHDVTTDQYGSFEIISTNFPDGFFTPEYGVTTITLLNEDGETEWFTFNGVLYDCIKLSFEYITDVTPI